MSRVRFRVFYNSIPYDISFKEEETISQLRLFILCVTGKLASEPLSSLVAKTERLKQTFLDNDAKNGRKYVINLSDMKDLSYAWVGPWDEHKVEEAVMIRDEVQKPVVEEPKVEEPKNEKNDSEERKEEEKVAEEPRVEELVVEDLKIEEKITEIPKTEERAIEEPKNEPEQPKIENSEPPKSENIENIQIEEPAKVEEAKPEPEPAKPVTIEFTYPMKKGTNNVKVVGTFNDWKKSSAVDMRKNNKEKLWKAKYEVKDTSSGEIQFKFIVNNSKWVLNEKLPKVKNDCGSFNNVFRF